MLPLISRNQTQQVLTKKSHQLFQSRQLSKSRKRRIPRKNETKIKSRALAPRRRHVKPLPSISNVLTSPKVHKKVSNKLSELKDQVLDVLPDVFKRRANNSEPKGPVMDAEWWRWNLALALTPSMFVMLVCEFNRADAEAYQRSEMLKANKKQYGDERVEEVDAELLAAKQGIFPKLWEAVSLLVTTGRDLIVNDINDHDDETKIESATDLDSHAKGVTDPVSIIQTQVPEENPNGVTTEELIERIRRLEKALQLQDQNTGITLPRSAINHGDRQAKVNQSGIRDRIEERIRIDYQLKEEQQMEGAENEKDSSSPFQEMSYMYTTVNRAASELTKKGRELFLEINGNNSKKNSDEETNQLVLPAQAEDVNKLSVSPPQPSIPIQNQVQSIQSTEEEEVMSKPVESKTEDERPSLKDSKASGWKANYFSYFWKGAKKDNDG